MACIRGRKQYLFESTRAHQKSFNVTTTLKLFVLYVRETHECGWIRTASARRTVRRAKSPTGAFLDARLATSTRAHPFDCSRVQTHRSCFIFVCAWCSSMQHILEVEKNGACVTNLSQKDYKPTFSTQKDCETIVYLVSYRGGWPIVPVCEKK